MNDLSFTYLTDGGQTADTVAAWLAGFIAAARQTLVIAIYDCALAGDIADTIAGAINGAAQRGVDVRLAYYGGPHRSPVIPPPHAPPPTSSAGFAGRLSVPTRPISGFQALMHDKYVVRDAGTPDAAVWTGSTNWTADAWDREENVIIQLPGPAMAAHFLADFEQLWASGQVDGTGEDAGGTDTVPYGGTQVPTQVWFSPGCGEVMAHAVADAIAGAQQRVVIASPVLTDGPILGALRDLVSAGAVPVTGVLDATQMAEVKAQWTQQQGGSWKIGALDAIVAGAHLTGKQSTPYTPTSVHDFMHAKMIVIDDTVFAGSYNFSRSGEGNAENLLRFDDGNLANACAAWIGQVSARYDSAPAWPA